MYRRQAAESRIKGFSNPVSIKGSLAVHLMLVGILVVSSGLIAFGLLTDYTRRATVEGFLRPKAGSVSVIATRAGQLFVEVPNGASVAAGEKIARIVGYDVDATGKSLLELEIQGLQEAVDLIDEQLKLARSRIAPLETQTALALAQHQRDIVSASTLVSSRREQLRIARDEMERSELLLSKGLIANAAMQEVQKRNLVAKQAWAEAKDNLASQEAQTENLEIDWRMRGVELRQTINALEQEHRSLERKVIQAEARRESGLFTPVGGVVTYSAAQDGEAVNVGMQLFQVTPQDSDLHAVLLAPSSAVGFVTVGDVVQIHYSAFSYREHGVFSGTVQAIDETAQLPSAIRAPISVSEPVYRVVVEIMQTPEGKSGNELRLAPGMMLEASIIIDQKPLLLWLLDPLL